MAVRKDLKIRYSTSVKFTLEHANKLKAIADEKRINICDVIRDSVARYLDGEDIRVSASLALIANIEDSIREFNKLPQVKNRKYVYRNLETYDKKS